MLLLSYWEFSVIKIEILKILKRELLSTIQKLIFRKKFAQMKLILIFLKFLKKKILVNQYLQS